MIHLKSIAKGVASNFVKPLRRSPTGKDGAFNARGSYAIFMRYLMALGEVGASFDDKIVVELGPGSSFGIGIAALLCGAKRYVAMDLIDHTDVERNLEVFDELCALFYNRAPIPIIGWCSKIFPFIDDLRFPSDLLPDHLLARTLDLSRLKEIRRDLELNGGAFIQIRSTEKIGSTVLNEPADVILSESVLEHVDDLASTYQAFARWLAPDGTMVHLIDYCSHNLSEDWNGHWQCSPLVWSLVRGKRYYLINRVNHQGHLDFLAATGMKVVKSQLLRRGDGITRDQFAPGYRDMPWSDALTALASIVCKRTT